MKSPKIMKSPKGGHSCEARTAFPPTQEQCNHGKNKSPDLKPPRPTPLHQPTPPHPNRDTSPQPAPAPSRKEQNDPRAPRPPHQTVSAHSNLAIPEARTGAR